MMLKLQKAGSKTGLIKHEINRTDLMETVIRNQTKSTWTCMRGLVGFTLNSCYKHGRHELTLCTLQPEKL